MRETLAFFRRVNFRHLYERRLRTFLTLSGVAAGVALIFSINVINGTLASTVRSSMRLLAGEAELEVAATDLSGLPQETVREVAAVEGVERVAPVTRTVARTTRGDESTKALWLGVTFEFASLFSSEPGPLSDVRLTGDTGAFTGGVVLAERLAQRLDAAPGAEISVQTPRGPRSVEVAGVLSGSVLDAVNGGDFGIMGLPAAQHLFDKAGRVDSIYVVTSPDAQPAGVQGDLEQALDGAATVGPPGERARAFERTFGTLQLLTSMAGVVALFVALFVVYNTMSMTVAERRREISLGLALGTRRRRIFGAFLTEAALLGALASTVGVVLGYFLARALVAEAIEGYRFVLPETTNGDVTVSARGAAFSFTGGVVVSVIGAFVPIKRILAMAPIEFLRPRAPFAPALSDIRTRAAVVALVVSAAATAVSIVLYLREPTPLVASAGLVALLTGVTVMLLWCVPWGIAAARRALGAGFGTVGRLAGTALERNIARTTATTAALLLSLGMVVGVGTAVESIEAQVARSAQGWFGAPLYVSSTSFNGFGSDQPLDRGFARRLEKVEGVAHAYPGRYGFVDIDGDQTIIYAISVARAAREGATDHLSSAGVDQEEFVATLGRGDVMISRYAARALSLEEGDTIAVPTPTGTREFDVGGVYDDLVPFYSMYMEHDTYAAAWDDPKVDSIALLPESSASASVVARHVEEYLERRDLPATVETRAEVIGGVGDISEGLVSIARAIQLAALIVAALTIANTMFIAVIERRWEFGLSRAVGMTPRQLGHNVFLEASAIG
ncbi:MAG: ABC transporter permease, partial [Actinomycetota bacterium]|nr:ABC transporter permease [Actinomycetota bacterium]